MEEALRVVKGSKILLHYCLSSESEVLESTEGREPLELVVGSGKLHPLIEKYLMGVKALEEVDVVIDPSVGFGEVDPKLIIEVPRHKLPEALHEVSIGQAFEAADFEGRTRLFRCVKKEGALLTFDANHELAGVPLYLEAKVVSIEPPAFSSATH